MTEKFKYGPLIWNHVQEEDDSGNYWWPGLPPVEYDREGIPLDNKGLQCLPISSPVHPDYESKNSVFHISINDYLPSLEEWSEWFDEHFIEISEDRIKREILKWYSRQSGKTVEFFKLQENCSTLDEMVKAVWQPDENK